MAQRRIGIFGMSQEAMLATPGHLDPRTVLISRGQEIVANTLWVARGIVATLQAAPDVEIVPLMTVRCRASAAFHRDFFDACVAEITALIRENGPFDGLVAANHGAMEVEGLDVSGDTALMEAVRQAAGPDVPITMALDMHGHLTPGLLRDAQGFAVFRTAPHRDDDSTGARAAALLLRILREGLRPASYAVHIPLLLPGEMAMTDYEPMRSLYAALPGIEQDPDVLGADYMVGFAWNDLPWVGFTAVATATTPSRARTLALDLAATLWARRREFRLQLTALPPREGLLEAGRLAATGPVLASDSGDNVTAGAYGDLTLVLQEALALPEIGPITVCNIIAPEAVAACREAGPGATVTLTLGAEHLSRPKTHLPVQGIVEATGEQLAPQANHHVQGPTGPWARVRFGHATATFHARHLQITTPGQLEAMGLDTRQGITVFKVGYLHPELEALGAAHVLLMSDGTSHLDLARLPYARIRRPAFPFEQGMGWVPAQGLYGPAA